MASMDQIKIDLQGIGYILKNNHLSVPKYQRSYAWEKQNVIDLLKDFSGAIDEGKGKEYFLGSIVISYRDPEKPEVVDGQQRLATTTILIAAIRDYFYNKGEKERATEITKTYLEKKDIFTLETIPFLQLNEVDHFFFEKKILSYPDSPDRNISPSKVSHKRIEIAFQTANNFFKNLISTSNNPVAKLLQWLTFLEEKAKVIWVRVPDDANAFTIFETLNDRGLPLAISDLLKNYLFHMGGDRLNEIQQNWVAMTEVLEAAESEELVITFLRHLWSSKYGITRERELYEKVKENITSKQQSVDFAQELKESSRLYAAMLNSQHEVWSDIGATARTHMSILNQLGMVQIRPLLLAVLEKFVPEETKRSLRLFVSWSVRFLIVGGLGGGALETQYCLRALQIRKGEIKSAKDLLEAMRSVVPSDAEFKKDFEVAQVSKSFLARYYLRVLENQSQGKAEPEFVPNENEELVTLEHILPENPSTAWGLIDQDTASTYFKRLGNLALLTHKINSDIGNQGFEKKKPFYQGSEYKLTNSISKYSGWGLEQIEKRQRDLADLAINAWPNRV